MPDCADIVVDEEHNGAGEELHEVYTGDAMKRGLNFTYIAVDGNDNWCQCFAKAQPSTRHRDRSSAAEHSPVDVHR
jgi:hypothetical protein